MVWACLQARQEEDIRMVAEMRVQGKRKRGIPKKIWYNTTREDMRRWRLSEDDVDKMAVNNRA